MQRTLTDAGRSKAHKGNEQFITPPPHLPPKKSQKKHKNNGGMWAGISPTLSSVTVFVLTDGAGAPARRPAANIGCACQAPFRGKDVVGLFVCVSFVTVGHAVLSLAVCPLLLPYRSNNVGPKYQLTSFPCAIVWLESLRSEAIHNSLGSVYLMGSAKKWSL